MTTRGQIIISPIHQEQLKNIGDHVKKLREAKGVSYEVFAIKNEINRISQYRLERGKNFQMSTLLKVINGLELTMEEFFSGLK